MNAERPSGLAEDRSGGRGAVVATVHVVVPRSKRSEVLHALLSVVGRTEAQPSCVRCRLYRDAIDDNSFLLEQEWENQAAVDRYIRSDLYRTILAVMDTASEAPEVRFHALAGTAGVEAVEAARRDAPTESRGMRT